LEEQHEEGSHAEGMSSKEYENKEYENKEYESKEYESKGYERVRSEDSIFLHLEGVKRETLALAWPLTSNAHLPPGYLLSSN
jgi:hypothetical protein